MRTGKTGSPTPESHEPGVEGKVMGRENEAVVLNDMCWDSEKLMVASADTLCPLSHEEAESGVLETLPFRLRGRGWFQQEEVG